MFPVYPLGKCARNLWKRNGVSPETCGAASDCFQLWKSLIGQPQQMNNQQAGRNKANQNGRLVAVYYKLCTLQFHVHPFGYNFTDFANKLVDVFLLQNNIEQNTLAYGFVARLNILLARGKKTI